MILVNYFNRSTFYFLLVLSSLLSFSISLQAQLLNQKRTFSRADSLRGSLRPERTCYDVQEYDLRVAIDTVRQSISGSCEIYFKAVAEIRVIQIDLADSMVIDQITFQGSQLYYTREYNAVFIAFLAPVAAGTNTSIRVQYHGSPVKAKRAPWDGGFVWSHDKNGKTWIGVACEGLGASSWWPCKDHLSDEPDRGIKISCTVPKGLKVVANGQYKGLVENKETNTYNYQVTYPINLYNVTLNIGDYIHWEDEYTAADGQNLRLNYDVLSYNADKAHLQFEQVKPMLKCYEKYLGKYPFWRDGYRLVETPYLGMEHQSAIAYGNKYKTGYDGMDWSGIGLKFDYIIIHESGHEWWGNSVSCRDLADMWIHEGFCTYTESIFVECIYGPDTAQRYINAKKRKVGNEAPIQGPYNVNEEGNRDMYNKGMLMLNTLRTVVNNDPLWWRMIKGISDTAFQYKVTDAAAVIDYFNLKSGMNLTPIFHQYLQHSAIPKLVYTLKKLKGKKYELIYFWDTDVKEFNMPILVTTARGSERLPTTNMIQNKIITLASESDFAINQERLYIALDRR